MERVIITISENGRVNIPDSNVWMSEMELVELFGVLAPTLRAAIKAIYKSEMLCPVSTQRCDLAMPKSWATFYNLEVVIALAFRLNTYEASRIRQKVLEGVASEKRMESTYSYHWEVKPQRTEYYHNSIGKRYLSLFGYITTENLYTFS